MVERGRSGSSERLTELVAALVRLIALIGAVVVSVVFFFAIIGIWEMPIAVGSLIAFIGLALTIVRWSRSHSALGDHDNRTRANHD